MENLNINGDAAEYAWFTPHHEKWVELRNTVIIPETELVGNGEKTVEEALAACRRAESVGGKQGIDVTGRRAQGPSERRPRLPAGPYAPTMERVL